MARYANEEPSFKCVQNPITCNWLTNNLGQLGLNFKAMKKKISSLQTEYLISVAFQNLEITGGFDLENSKSAHRRIDTFVVVVKAKPRPPLGRPFIALIEAAGRLAGAVSCLGRVLPETMERPPEGRQPARQQCWVWPVHHLVRGATPLALRPPPPAGR